MQLYTTIYIHICMREYIFWNLGDKKCWNVIQQWVRLIAKVFCADLHCRRRGSSRNSILRYRYFGTITFPASIETLDFYCLNHSHIYIYIKYIYIKFCVLIGWKINAQPKKLIAETYKACGVYNVGNFTLNKWNREANIYENHFKCHSATLFH